MGLCGLATSRETLRFLRLRSESRENGCERWSRTSDDHAYSESGQFVSQMKALNAQIAEQNVRIDQRFVRIDERFERIEKELAEIKAILFSHEQILQTLPEAIRQKIGFGEQQ